MANKKIEIENLFRNGQSKSSKIVKVDQGLGLDYLKSEKKSIFFMQSYSSDLSYIEKGNIHLFWQVLAKVIVSLDFELSS